jgi:hypothetical protein
MKTTLEHCKKEPAKILSTEQMPILLIKNERIKDQENASDIFNTVY